MSLLSRQIFLNVTSTYSYSCVTKMVLVSSTSAKTVPKHRYNKLQLKLQLNAAFANTLACKRVVRSKYFLLPKLSFALRLAVTSQRANRLPHTINVSGTLLAVAYLEHFPSRCHVQIAGHLEWLVNRYQRVHTTIEWQLPYTAVIIVSNIEQRAWFSQVWWTIEPTKIQHLHYTFRVDIDGCTAMDMLLI